MKKSSTDGVFKSELTRATGSIIDYLNSDEDVTASEMIEKLEDLRDYMDDSIEQTGMELYSSYTFSCRFSEPEITGESTSRISIRMARKTTLNRRQTMRQTIRKTVVSKGESVVRRSILRKGNNYFVDLGQGVLYGINYTFKSDNVYDKKQVVEEFEKIRDVFEDIQTKITLKQARVHGFNHLSLNLPVSGFGIYSEW